MRDLLGTMLYAFGRRLMIWATWVQDTEDGLSINDCADLIDDIMMLGIDAHAQSHDDEGEWVIEINGTPPEMRN